MTVASDIAHRYRARGISLDDLGSVTPGPSAMLAEAADSVADSMNQGFLTRLPGPGRLPRHTRTTRAPPRPGE